ncbi:MAG: tRNA ((37)-N6)-threonylcarbamoyltransferase complex transferase subunit TsaD [Candidatus Parcubacteria bacterium]|jgi:N6-L-threonylcarbamoyladenine synthase
MKILSIETSCDETAVALVEVSLSDSSIHAHTMQAELFSQIDIHKEFGGVFPIVAKREHATWLPILLERVLARHPRVNGNPGIKQLDPRLREDDVTESEDDVVGSEDDVVGSEDNTVGSEDNTVGSEDGVLLQEIESILARENGLFEKTKILLEKYSAPDIDMIAVTQGPGLEPALWVGISFAKALSLYWNIPLVGTNHMKGHIFSVLLNQSEVQFPSLALLISGGHTELVEMNSISEFKIIGQTRDDAIGESYDKVARMIGLEYPGGPKIAELASQARHLGLGSGPITLPRPMIHTPDLDFSFSGLKTAVLYKTREFEFLDQTTKMHIAHEFEQAITDVILYKLKKALTQRPYKSLIISGGVIANTYLRTQIEGLASSLDIPLLLPKISDSTDNAQMIAVAGAIESLSNKPTINPQITAQGSLQY